MKWDSEKTRGRGGGGLWGFSRGKDSGRGIHSIVTVVSALVSMLVSEPGNV